MINKSAIYLVIAAFYGLSAVILGALGIHAFGLAPGTQQSALFQHAFIYQIIHALLLIWIVTQQDMSLWMKNAAMALTIGVLLFCGGLYLLVFVGRGSFSWITPLGGGLIIFAWLNLVIHGLLKLKKNPNHFEP